MKAIECKEVTKIVGKNTILNKMSFGIEKGKICAVLCKEEDEKTALFNCLCTKYLPTEGEVFLLEESAYENRKVLNEVSFMSAYIDAFSTRNVKNILKYAKSFYKKKWNKELADSLLKIFEIDMYASYEKLSAEKQAAVGTVLALCSNCEIVLLNSVYCRLTKEDRKGFWDTLLEKQKESSRTFVISIERAEDLEDNFTDILVLDKGQVILRENSQNDKEKIMEEWGNSNGNH